MEIVEVRQVRVGECAIGEALEDRPAAASESTGGENEACDFSSGLSVSEEDDALVGDESVEEEDDGMGELTAGVEMGMEGTSGGESGRIGESLEKLDEGVLWTRTSARRHHRRESTHVADFSREGAERNSDREGDRYSGLGRDIDSSVDDFGFEPVRVFWSRRRQRRRPPCDGCQSIRLVLRADRVGTRFRSLVSESVHRSAGGFFRCVRGDAAGGDGAMVRVEDFGAVVV